MLKNYLIIIFKTLPYVEDLSQKFRAERVTSSYDFHGIILGIILVSACS